jgi:hypothetical protein
MAIPTNTYTVTIADAHSHTVPQSGVPAATKQDAVRNVLNEGDADFGVLVQTDTWTITVTQP